MVILSSFENGFKFGLGFTLGVLVFFLIILFISTILELFKDYEENKEKISKKVLENYCRELQERDEYEEAAAIKKYIDNLDKKIIKLIIIRKYKIKKYKNSNPEEYFLKKR